MAAGADVPVLPGNRDDLDAIGRPRTVYSWVVVTHPVDEVLVDQVPYVVGLIDLPEGVRVVGNVVGGEPGDLSGRRAVELFFEDAEDGMRMPSFRRVDHREGETR